jgi:ornithine cyclodeaminase/alanine dehydrogenase
VDEVEDLRSQDRAGEEFADHRRLAEAREETAEKPRDGEGEEDLQEYVGRRAPRVAGGLEYSAPHGGDSVTDADAILYLSRDDVASLEVGMDEVVVAVEGALREKGRGRAEMPPKLSLHGEGGAFSQVMAASLPGLDGLGVKWVTIVPANAAAGLAVVNGLIVLNDPATGLPAAVMDASLVTAWRTGASVGVAARHLARAGTDCVGLLGCGVQGRAAVDALAVVLPGLRAVRCCDVVAEAAAAFARELRDRHPDLEPVVCEAATDVPRGAGVVVSAITMSDAPPPLGAGSLEEGALAVALDYDAAWSAAAMAECGRFFCDDTAQVLATKAAGPRLGGIPEAIAGDLGEIAAGVVPGRRDDGERLFCLNLGVAVEDVVTAGLVLERARERGAGRSLPL